MPEQAAGGYDAPTASPRPAHNPKSAGAAVAGEGARAAGIAPPTGVSGPRSKQRIGSFGPHGTIMMHPR